MPIWDIKSQHKADRMQQRFIIIDSNPDSSALVRSHLASAGFNEAHIERDPLQAILLFESQPRFDIALIDVNLLKGGGHELLETVIKVAPGTECIVLAAAEDTAAAVQCLRQGAYDCLTKPFSQQQIVSMVKRALERKRLLDVFQAERSIEPPALANAAAFKNIVTGSGVFLRMLRAAELLAAGDAPILITGENGIGKSLLAKAIHDAGPGTDSPFLALDSASLGENELEEALRSQAAGTSIGKEPPPEGQLKRGPATAFLDGIENLPAAMQGQLLRVIQDGGFQPLENSGRENIDVRVVAATNADVESMMRAGEFRQDLFRHFRGSGLHLPPLRERPEDITLLSHHFLKKWGKPAEAWRLEGATTAALLAYGFPGNVDELQAILREAIERAQGRVITAECLPDYVQRSTSALALSLPPGSPPMPLADLEKSYILNLYRQMNHNKVRTARALGIGLNTVRRKLKAYGVK